MSESGDQHSDLDRLRDLPIRSEELGFAPNEMIACEKCARGNAPNRSECIYCGAHLGGETAPQSKLDFREPESWESGFNVIVMRPGEDSGHEAAKMLAGILSAEPDVILTILESGKALPVARVASEANAAFIEEKLAGCGLDTRTVSDEALVPSQVPVRLRKLEFASDGLKFEVFGKDESGVIAREDLGLIVPGVLLEGRTESIEKRKRRANVTLSETQTSSDQPVIDIYSKHDPLGWRIPASGFDFSCLGAQKSLLVADNMESLVARLAAYSPTAKLANDYPNVRPLLEHCWPSESRRDGLGLQRSGFARKNLASVFTTNNLLQFTKYSRLQWHLL
jgi:hypothetical protein